MFEMLASISGEIVSVLIACTLLFGWVTGYRVVQKSNAAYLEEQAVVEGLEEVREFNIYDDNTLRGQDVISALLQYKGYPNIIIYNSNGTISKIYDENTPQAQYSVSALNAQNILSPENTFKTELGYDDNGTVDTIKFKKVD